MKISGITRIARRGLLVLAVGAIAFAIAGCGSSPSVKGSAPAPKQEAAQEEQKTTDLAAGTAVDMGNGLTVSVDSIETGVAGNDGTYVKATVTYKNEGDDTASYNEYDWKGEDANGAQEHVEYYMSPSPDFKTDDNALSSGDLAAGGTKTGTLYFKEGTVKLVYTGNMFAKDVQASWAVV